MLNRFEDFVNYLNRVTRGTVKRFIGIHEFDKPCFKEVYNVDFSVSYGARQILYNKILGQEKSGSSDAKVNF